MTRSLICFRSLKSPISALNIDTGFLGFFSGLIMTLRNMNIKLFCATTESDEPRIFKRWFLAHQNCDVCKCFSRCNLILCIRLSKNLQACTSKWHDFKYKILSRKVKNYTYNLMNFDSLSAENDKCDFGLIKYECRKPRSIAFSLSKYDSQWLWLWCDSHFNLLKQLPSMTGKPLSASITVQ